MRSPLLRKITNVIEDVYGIPSPVEFGPAPSRRYTERCPICRGRGVVPDNFYQDDVVTFPKNRCRSCDGRGWVAM